MDRSAGITTSHPLGQGSTLFSSEANTEDQVRQALEQMFTDDHAMQFMQQVNKKAERELGFREDLAYCSQLAKNSLQLFTIDLKDFSTLKPTYLGQGEMADGEIPEHLVILTDPNTRCVRYFGPSPCAMTEAQSFVTIADQVTNFIVQARKLKPTAAGLVKPFISYSQQLADTSVLEPLTAAGYDVLARLANNSPIGTSAVDAAIKLKLHQGKGKRYSELMGISHVEVPKAQCPVLSTGQTLHLHVFVMPQFFDLPEQHVFALANLDVPEPISAAQRTKLRAQALRNWCYILATTAELDVSTMLNAYWEHDTLVDELRENQEDLQSMLPKPIDGSTFMGSLYCLFQGHTMQEDMPEFNDMADELLNKYGPFPPFPF